MNKSTFVLFTCLSLRFGISGWDYHGNRSRNDLEAGFNRPWYPRLYLRFGLPWPICQMQYRRRKMSECSLSGTQYSKLKNWEGRNPGGWRLCKCKINIFGMAAMPFFSNGLLINQINLPRVNLAFTLKSEKAHNFYASFLIPYFYWSHKNLNWIIRQIKFRPNPMAGCWDNLGFIGHRVTELQCDRHPRVLSIRVGELFCAWFQ